jgi:hypothetical protein
LAITGFVAVCLLVLAAVFAAGMLSTTFFARGTDEPAEKSANATGNFNASEADASPPGAAQADAATNSPGMPEATPDDPFAETPADRAQTSRVPTETRGNLPHDDAPPIVQAPGNQKSDREPNIEAMDTPPLPDHPVGNVPAELTFVTPSPEASIEQTTTSREVSQQEHEYEVISVTLPELAEDHEKTTLTGINMIGKVKLSLLGVQALEVSREQFKISQDSDQSVSIQILTTDDFKEETTHDLATLSYEPSQLHFQWRHPLRIKNDSQIERMAKSLRWCVVLLEGQGRPLIVELGEPIRCSDIPLIDEPHAGPTRPRRFSDIVFPNDLRIRDTFYPKPDLKQFSTKRLKELDATNTLLPGKLDSSGAGNEDFWLTHQYPGEEKLTAIVAQVSISVRRDEKKGHLEVTPKLFLQAPKLSADGNFESLEKLPLAFTNDDDLDKMQEELIERVEAADTLHHKLTQELSDLEQKDPTREEVAQLQERLKKTIEQLENVNKATKLCQDIINFCISRPTLTVELQKTYDGLHGYTRTIVSAKGDK